MTLEESPGVASRELSTRRTVLWLGWAVGSVQGPVLHNLLCMTLELFGELIAR